MNAVYNAFLEYRERYDWRVLPVLPDKTPALDVIEATRGTRRWGGLRDEPAETKEIRRWLGLDPGVGVGVICGGGLVVVDVETPEDNERLGLPDTVCSRTQSGGFHHYFRSDEPIRGRSFDWGEVRADGLYVVSPPTIGENGPYRWSRAPEGRGLEPLPADFANLCVPSRYLSSLRRSEFSWANLGEVDTREDVVLRLLEALGVAGDVRVGRAFSCVMHDDVRPSATVRRSEDGVFLYHCFAGCGPERRQWFTLAEVRARQAGRRAFRLGRVERALWWLDLLERAGLIEGVAFDGSEPPERLLQVWVPFLRLLGLRALTSPAGRPTPFARAFAGPWCELPEYDLRVGFDELRRLGFVRFAGRDAHGLALWLPHKGVRPVT